MNKFLLTFYVITSIAYSQQSGCTDPLSNNYNPTATYNDGSCRYDTVKLKPIISYPLNDTLHETSGLIYYDGLFWTHNDDHDTALYGLDSLGIIQKKVTLKNVKNQDWESIAQDEKSIFIGDFGNNSSGNRTNLKIYRIAKNTLYTQNPVIDTISFSYSKQTDFTKQKGNTTDFDCEAFIVQNDSIYLFTKEWTQKKTSIYVLPNASGNNVAQFKKTIDVEGIITDATLDLKHNTIVLCGYTATYQTFLFLLYDYKSGIFGSGNKRRVKLDLPFHQIEGITTTDGSNYYLTNEKTTKKPIVNNKPQLHLLNLESLLKNEKD